VKTMLYTVAVIGSVYGIAFNAKFLTSFIVGAIGTAAAIVRNISEINEDRSKITIERTETTKLAALLDLLVRMPTGDAYVACKQELESQVAHCVSRLNAVRLKALKRALAPNRDLTFLQRMFVCFPPATKHGWIIHFLAYLFLAGGPFTILMLVLFRSDPGTIGDVSMLILFGTMAFRQWALAERKWTTGCAEKQAGNPSQSQTPSLSRLIVLRKPSGRKMLVAQICMWACIFCAAESLEDILLAGFETYSATNMQKPKASIEAGRQAMSPRNLLADTKGGFLLLLISLLNAGLCRAWAFAEWLRGVRSEASCGKAEVHRLQPTSAKTWLLVIGYGAAIALFINSIVSGPRIFSDLIDRIEIVFLGLAACVAFHRLLNCHANGAKGLSIAGNFHWAQSPNPSQTLAD
jgi:hypothetical protein